MNDIGIDSYLATIDELVEDENKIVTYKFLSHQLALPINKAKEVLKYYLTNCEAGKIGAVYALTGRSNGKIKCTLVNDEKLEATKSKFDAVISTHVYSVQKTKLKDVSSLYNADYELTRTLLYKYASFGMIRYNGAKQLSDEEINGLRSLTITKQPSPMKPLKPAKPISTNNTEKKVIQKKQQSSFFAPKPSSKNTDAKGDESDKNGLKSNSENNRTNSESSNKPEVPKTVGKPPQKRKGMDLFMTKGKSDLFETHRSSAKTTKVEEVNGSKCTSPKQNNSLNDISLNEAELVELAEKMDADDQVEASDSIQPQPAEKNTNDSSTKENKETKQKENNSKPKKSLARKSKSTKANKNAQAKKRKRIKEVSSSSSNESEEEDFDNFDVIPSSPVAPPPKVNTAPKNPRKKRVLKSHTYVDKDGSMLTEKIWEEVSCSSSEEEDSKPVKQKDSPPEAKPAVKKAAAFKGKQSSIMGFFSKKS